MMERTISGFTRHEKTEVEWCIDFVLALRNRWLHGLCKTLMRSYRKQRNIQDDDRSGALLIVLEKARILTFAA